MTEEFHSIFRQMAELIAVNARTAIEGWSGPLHWEPVSVTVDEFGVVTVGRWGGYLLQICRKLFNERFVLTPDHEFAYGYDHGWCYTPGVAIVALLTWDPDTEGEPSGYLKRATLGLRQPGEQARTPPAISVRRALRFDDPGVSV